jgi:CheY-like chemotaxis protein
METNQIGCLPKVLVVDDHEASCRHLIGALSGMELDVESKGTGLKALRTAIRWLPQLIFMDIHLPDSDGLDIARQIRELWPPSSPPATIVLLSAENPRNRQDEMNAQEIQHAIIKPVSGRALRELTSELLGMSRPPSGSRSIKPELRKLLITELEQQLPQLELHLLQDDRELAVFLVHQLIGAAAMSGEKRLEENFIMLNRLLRQPTGAAELASAYYGTHQAVQSFLRQSGVSASG